MQATERSTPPTGPSAAHEYLRSRTSVTRAYQGRLESVRQLAVASEGGRRAPWVLPPMAKRWREPISARLMLLFLGWVLEGSVRPRRGKGGAAILCDSEPRLLIGAIETRDQAGELVAGAWPRLLVCSAKQARRCIHLAERLGLVEQLRNREPRLGAKCEQAAAYLPTEKLLAWMHDRGPAEDLFELPPKEKKCLTPESSPESYVGEVFAVSALPEAGHRAPDELAASEAPSPEASPATGFRPAEAWEREGRRAEGGEGPPRAGRLLQFAARATGTIPPPLEAGDVLPPDVGPATLGSFLIARQAEQDRKPSPADDERRLRAFKKIAERAAARALEPPGSDGPGGAS
jgi:hypothetical protein